jgi:RHS repeat-associated protein
VGDVAVYTNGLLVRSARLSASGEEHGVVTYEYDPFGRKSAVHSLAANGEAVTTRFAYDILGRCTNTSVGVGGKIRSSSNEFDVMGRRIRAVLADGAAQEFGYDSRGNLVRQSGSRLYPVTYAYTEQGRMAAMSTYRNGLAGQADTTRWSHDSAQGLLTNKVYADGKGTSYSYTPDGKLSSRTWARSIGPSRLQTSYAYDSLGQMTNISYSDGVTPDVSFAYDRLGRQKTITDGQGTRTFAYDDQLRLVSETQKTAAGTNMLVRSYDESGRHAGLALFSPSDTSNPSYESDYSYDSLGRFCSVSWSNAGESDLRSEYRYSSGDATTITGRLVRANGNTVLQSGTVHDGLGRVTSLRTITASGEVVGNSYGYNDADQRVANVLADGSGWSYRYDELGQLTGGSKRFADGNPVGGSRFEYSFDTIGNRVSAGNFNGQRTKMESYSASGLNQYEQRTVPGQVWVTGEASADARVIARLDDHRPVLASRHGDYFWALVPVSNELGSVSSTNLSITAMLPVPPGSPTGTLVRTETRSVAVPGTPERFAYDEDGNLLSDGLWTYAWDAENRLISVESRSGVPAASSFRCDYSYDYMGRRFCSVRSVSGVATTNFFTYDGWLLLHSSEICHLPSEIRTNASWFVWGPDIAEQMGAGVPRHSAPGATAGGIGGLLFILTPDSCLLTPSFDASGNVTALASTSGAIVASYEYGPFGEPLRASGPAASANPFRFSTKYTDPETGLLYYGYRYYSPSLGRWLSRDPIGEAGGVNAYGACRNDLLTCSDGLGLWGTDVHRDKTIEWAKALRMPESGADLIGEYDDKVDEDFDPKVLVDEKWSWHFDRSSGGEDSRLLHSKEQLALAKRFCDWRHGNRDDWEQASLFVGRSLHPDQDWVAHGDFNRRREAPSLQGQSWLDQRHYWHNWDAPCGTVGAGRNDPDESSLDANGPDGRATIPVLHAGTHLSNGDQTYWAYFHPGQRRLLLTESRTKGTIQDFVEFVKKNGKRCGECERAFVGGP